MRLAKLDSVAKAFHLAARQTTKGYTMSSLLGFKLDFWDYATFAVLMILVFSGLTFIVWLMGLPGRIAIARKHPDAEAVKIMGYSGFLAVVPWIQAFIWAFKPTDIIDIRRFPKAEAAAIEEDIQRLAGEPKQPKHQKEAKRPAEPKAKEPPAAESTDASAAAESDKQS
jgi:hypothetical protein